MYTTLYIFAPTGVPQEIHLFETLIAQHANYSFENVHKYYLHSKDIISKGLNEYLYFNNVKLLP